MQTGSSTPHLIVSGQGEASTLQSDAIGERHADGGSDDWHDGARGEHKNPYGVTNTLHDRMYRHLVRVHHPWYEYRQRDHMGRQLVYLAVVCERQRDVEDRAIAGVLDPELETKDGSDALHLG